MLVTTKQIVKKLPTTLKLLSILEEAITNSIQANSTEVSIYFDTIDISLLEDMKAVKNMTIVDNGDGFTNKNIDSFNHYLSEYKQDFGCKGIGRFTYLTICDDIKFYSYNNGKNIQFNFNINTEQITPVEDNTSELKKRTKILFSNIKDRNVSSDLKHETKDVINHFLSTFKFMVDDGKNLFIKFFMDDKLVDTIEAKEHGEGFTDKEFDIKVSSSHEEKFTISYKQKGSSIKGFYCADKRSVRRDKLDIKLRTPKDKGLLYFVSSDFFDATVNDERTDFDIKDKNNTLYDNSLDWDMLNKKLFSNIDTICKANGIDIEETKNKNKKKV